MEKLRTYLNSLSRAEQHAYAKACGTSVSYLRKAICIKQKLDGELCVRLDIHSHGAVPREDLRPCIWPDRINNAHQYQHIKEQ